MRVIIDRIAPFSPAAKAGLKARSRIDGFEEVVITKKNCRRPASTVQQKEVGDEVIPLIDRGERERRSLFVWTDKENVRERRAGANAG